MANTKDKVHLLKVVKFAEFVGISRQTVYNDIRSGKVKIRKDGYFDTLNPQNLEYIKKHNNGREKQPNPEIYSQPKKQRKSRAKNKIKKASIKKENIDKPKPKYESPFIEDDEPPPVTGTIDPFSLDMHTISQAELEKRKIVASIQEKTLKIDKERQEVVSRDLVSLLLARIVAVDVNEFIPLADSIVSEVAAIYGVNDAKKDKEASIFIRKKIFKSIEHKNKMINKYLKDIKAVTNTVQTMMNETMIFIKKMLNGFKK